MWLVKPPTKRKIGSLIITQYYVAKRKARLAICVEGQGWEKRWGEKLYLFSNFSLKHGRVQEGNVFFFFEAPEALFKPLGLFFRNDKKKYKNPMSSEKEIVSEKKLQIDVTENKVTIDINGVGVIYDRENFISIIESTDSFKHALQLRENLL
jgi:hypothetical protein